MAEIQDRVDFVDGRSSIGYKTRCTFRIALLKLALCLSAEMLLNGIVGSRPPPRGISAMVKVAGKRVYLVVGHFFRGGIDHLTALDALRPSSRFSTVLSSQCAFPSASI